MSPFEIGCLLLRLGAAFSDWVPPFEIAFGCLLFGLGASFGDWVPPFPIGSLRLGLPIGIVLFPVWPPDFRSLIGVRVRPVQIEYYLQRSYPIEYKRNNHTNPCSLPFR